MKRYKRNWVNAGIAYRKDVYMVIKPDQDNPNWLVRRVHGAAGQQDNEIEGTFTSERKAFKFANKAVWRAKWNRFINNATD